MTWSSNESTNRDHNSGGSVTTEKTVIIRVQSIICPSLFPPIWTRNQLCGKNFQGMVKNWTRKWGGGVKLNWSLFVSISPFSSTRLSWLACQHSIIWSGREFILDWHYPSHWQALVLPPMIVWPNLHGQRGSCYCVLSILHQDLCRPNVKLNWVAAKVSTGKCLLRAVGPSGFWTP